METKAREVYPTGPVVEVTIGLTEDEILTLFTTETSPRSGVPSLWLRGRVYDYLRAAIDDLRPGRYAPGVPR